MKKTLSVLFVAALVGAATAAAFEDYNLTATDAKVKRVLDGDNLVYIFTNPDAGAVTVTLKEPMTLERVLLVGGGGAGGWTIGGGGAGGGFVETEPAAALAAEATLSLSVGAGGDPQASAPGTTWPRGGNGGDSTLAFGETSVVARGGGGGGSWSSGAAGSGTLGSGGGCSNGSKANTPSGTTYQGHPGGQSLATACSGGGGGAGGVGGNGTGTTAGDGGPGLLSAITGTLVEYAAGGGGGAGNECLTSGKAGGPSAGAGATRNTSTRGVSAPAGFGGGGGGGGFSGATCGGAGGSGTVILRFANGTIIPKPRVDFNYPKYKNDGTITFAGTLDGVCASATTVKLLWGYAADALTEVAVASIEPDAASLAFAKTLNGIEPDKTVYWKIQAVMQVGGAPCTEETVGEISTYFVPPDATTPIYEITVESGTKDLTAWMAEQEPAITEITGGGTIVVKGSGTLTVSTAALAGFTGDVYIGKGMEVMTSVANPLGTTAGKVVVDHGATLHTTWSNADTAVSFGNKPVYIAGTGKGDKGAIYAHPLKGNTDSGHPGVVYLTDDAKGCCSGQTRIGGTVYLEGYTFTVDYQGGWTYLQQTYRDTTGRGNIIIAREILWEGSSPKFECGTAANTVTVKNGAGYRTNSYSQNKNYPWTLVMQGNSYFYCGGGTSSWYGDVILENGRHYLTHQNLWSTQNYYGKVSGPGGIGSSTNSETEKFGLLGLENDFTGGVYLKRNVLVLGGNGSLPAAGAALTNYNGTVQFKSSTDVHDLPEAYFSGTGAVNCATAGARALGAWRRQMTKAGTGELIYDSLVGSPKLVVTGGSVKFPVTEANAELPVFTNVQVRTGASVQFGDGYAGAWKVPNLVSGGGEIRAAVNAEGFVVDTAVAGETVKVTGALAFAANAEVTVPADLPHRPSNVYTLVTAPSIMGLPKSANEKWYTQIVNNGDNTQSLKLVYGVGLRVFVR